MKQKALRLNIYQKEYVAFRSALKALRLKNDISQAELANRLNTEQSHISRIEKGVRQIDFVELIFYIKALGVSKEDFFMEIARQGFLIDE